MAKTVLRPPEETQPMAVLRLPEVMQRTGLRRSSIYKRIAANEFPRGFSLGGSARGWLNSEISDWIAARAATRETERRTLCSD